MPTADEALASATTISTDATVDYVIDKDLRTTAIPTRGVVLGVEGDKDVNTVRFECPRYYKGVDLFGFSCNVLYVNANGDVGTYEVTDMADGDGTLSFTWLVSALAVAYQGAVRFEVMWQEKDDGGKVKRAYNTTIATANCLDGLEGDALSDIDAESLLNQLLSAQSNANAAADSANAAAESATNAAKSANDAALEAKQTVAAAYAYVYKGSVASTSLPTSGQRTGDVYNLTDDSTYGAAGMNVAWDGEKWDALGSNVDLSGKQDKLTAGDNVQISDDNVISATGGTPTAGNGIAVDGSKVSIASPAVNQTDINGYVTAWTENSARSSGSNVGQYSHAEGSGTTASGNYGHTEGYNTTANSNASHAEGWETTASGIYGSHAEGSGTTASGIYGSHAEGSGTTASGSYSHAEGSGTTASGNDSHAEGASTRASGNDSHAEGYWVTASGNYSHAGGYGTIADGCVKTAIGKYNETEAPDWKASTAYAVGDLVTVTNSSTKVTTIYKCKTAHTSGTSFESTNWNVESERNPGKYALVIGNGTSDTARSNALSVDWEGNVECGTVNGVDVTGLTPANDATLSVIAYDGSVSTFTTNQAVSQSVGKAMTTAQLAAANSGITSDKVSTYDGYLASKQDALTAGDNITIDGTTISAKDTTYKTISYSFINGVGIAMTLNPEEGSSLSTTIPLATNSQMGFMSAADKAKLDSMVATTVAVGTVSTLEAGAAATVANSGTSNAVVLDFGIPTGAKGDKGDTGATGAKGDALTISETNKTFTLVAADAYYTKAEVDAAIQAALKAAGVTS